MGQVAELGSRSIEIFECVRMASHGAESVWLRRPRKRGEPPIAHEMVANELVVDRQHPGGVMTQRSSSTLVLVGYTDESKTVDETGQEAGHLAVANLPQSVLV